MINLNLDNLAGTYRHQTSSGTVCDFTITSDGKYDLYDYQTKKRSTGTVNLQYSSESNTVTLILNNYGTVLIFQILNDGFVFDINNQRLYFHRVL